MFGLYFTRHAADLLRRSDGLRQGGLQPLLPRHAGCRRLLAPSAFEAGFVSAAHSEADVEIHRRLYAVDAQSTWTLTAMAASVVLLAWSLKTLPVGTAYAVWTGVGAVGTAILGMVLFNESREVARLVCIGLIVAGILGLKLVTK
jgi:multidrug transporter EmrE-like cation transporter